MGIKFLCPNGHKLNVKTFLAGKRAICPKCGARLIVPAATAGGSDNDAAGSSTILTSDEMAANQPPAEATAAAGPGVPAAASPSAADAAHRLAPVQLADPIAEAPSAVWYVRPASGGQFGPASGDLMRSWINEGRVGASSLVWRAGWSDWRPAAATFAQLASLAAPPGGGGAFDATLASTNGSTVPGASELPAAENLIGASRAAAAKVPDAVGPVLPPVRHRKRERDANLLASVVLMGIILILVVVLVVVFMRNRTPTEEAPQEAAPVEDPLLN